MVEQRFYAKTAFVLRDGAVLAVFPDQQEGRRKNAVMTINLEGEEEYRDLDELRELEVPTTAQAAPMYAKLMQMNYLPVLVERF